MSKRFFKSFLSSLLALLMIVSLAAIPSSAATIALSKTSISLTKGYATTLKVTGTSNTVSWSTGDKSVATVSTRGKVVGKSLGTTYIYAKVSGKTLKCKVKIVAGKITAATDDVEIGVGDKTTVTITALGTHVISAASTDKSVVKATWSGAKFDGNKIKLTLTGVSQGTARVKVYAKNYSKTVYKYIDVSVGSSGLSDDDSGSSIDSSTTVVIAPLVESVSVEAKASFTFKVYASDLNSISVTSANTSIATASVSTSKNKYIPIKVTGVSSGSTTLKIYAKNNSNNYVTIPVTVNSSTSTYYNVLTTYPTKLLSTDTVIQFSATNGTRYMLAPYGYDIAYVNNLIATNLGYYSYYQLYISQPSKIASTDTIKSITTVFNGASVARYMLLPSVVDQPQVDTAVAQYTGTYEYYKIYTSSPTQRYISDQIVTWTKDVITNNKTQTITRYVLVQFGFTDSQEVTDLKQADLNLSYNTYYTVYTAEPTRIKSTDSICMWIYNGKINYMLLPATPTSSIVTNDSVGLLTGYCYFTVYSTVPTVGANDSIQITYSLSNGTNTKGYLVIDSTLTSANIATLIKTGVQGTYNSSYPIA